MGSYTNREGLRRSARIHAETSLIQNEEYERYYECMHEDDYKIQDQMQEPISFVATSNKDAMYFPQAMKEPDAEELKK